MASHTVVSFFSPGARHKVVSFLASFLFWSLLKIHFFWLWNLKFRKILFADDSRPFRMFVLMRIVFFRKFTWRDSLSTRLLKPKFLKSSDIYNYLHSGNFRKVWKPHQNISGTQLIRLRFLFASMFSDAPRREGSDYAIDCVWKSMRPIHQFSESDSRIRVIAIFETAWFIGFSISQLVRFEYSLLILRRKKTIMLQFCVAVCVAMTLENAIGEFIFRQITDWIGPKRISKSVSFIIFLCWNSIKK